MKSRVRRAKFAWYASLGARINDRALDAPCGKKTILSWRWTRCSAQQCSAIADRCHSDVLRKDSSELTLIGESALPRDLRQGLTGLDQAARAFDALFQHVLVGRRPGARTERAGELPHAQTGFRSQ